MTTTTNITERLSVEEDSDGSKRLFIRRPAMRIAISARVSSADVVALIAALQPRSEGTTPAPATPNNWQPIETAPKDGTDVLLCWDDGIAAPMFDVGRRLGDDRRWQNTHDWLHNAQSWPTHWMPLPDPPAAARSPGAVPEARPHETTKEEDLTRREKISSPEQRSTAPTDTKGCER